MLVIKCYLIMQLRCAKQASTTTVVCLGCLCASIAHYVAGEIMHTGHMATTAS